jgi:hypothetical protein
MRSRTRILGWNGAVLGPSDFLSEFFFLISFPNTERRTTEKDIS